MDARQRRWRRSTDPCRYRSVGEAEQIDGSRLTHPHRRSRESHTRVLVQAAIWLCPNGLRRESLAVDEEEHAACDTGLHEAERVDSAFPALFTIMLYLTWISRYCDQDPLRCGARLGFHRRRWVWSETHARWGWAGLFESSFHGGKKAREAPVVSRVCGWLGRPIRRP